MAGFHSTKLSKRIDKLRMRNKKMLELSHMMPECHAEGYVMIDADSGRILINKGAFKKTYPASTTKVLTFLLALKKFGDLEATVTVPEVTGSGSLMGIEAGEQLRIIDLLYGLMLPSGNDAAEALAILSSGSIEKFVQEMNELAKDIGCSERSHFVNPHGIFRSKHTTCAYDMALITKKAMENPLFNKVVCTTVYTCKTSKKTLTLQNTNALLHQKSGNKDRRYIYATGVKTGTTGKGYSLISSATKNDVNLIQVYLHSQTDLGTPKGRRHRFIDSKALFEFAFDNYRALKKHPIIIK